MTDAITIPREALRYLLLQRTGYLRIPRAPVIGQVLRTMNRGPLKRLGLWDMAARLEGRLRPDQVVLQYQQDLSREMSSIGNFLPEKCGSIVDIGCGLAGIDVLLNKHYEDRGQEPHFTLVDRTYVSRQIFYGFKSEAAYYNSLALTEAVLESNGVSRNRYTIRDVGEDSCLGVDRGSIDLVISLISWGYHYPVEVYLDQVLDGLTPLGHVVLDLRKGEGGDAVLRECFEEVAVISETETQLRIRARFPKRDRR